MRGKSIAQHALSRLLAQATAQLVEVPRQAAEVDHRADPFRGIAQLQLDVQVNELRTQAAWR